MTDYLKTLEAHVSEYAGTLRDVVQLAPVFAHLMFQLLNDPRLPGEQRLWVDAALAYLVSPHDVIPEDTVGPYGYLDDIFCCAFVTNRLGEALGWDVVEEAWTGRNSAEDVSGRLLAREQEILGHAGEDVLRFAGLLERVGGDEGASDSDAGLGSLSA